MRTPADHDPSLRDREQPLLEVRLDRDRVVLRRYDGFTYRLTADEATALANALTDAVDQLDGRETSDALTMTLDEAAQEYESPK